MNLSQRAEKLISLGQRVERPTEPDVVAQYLQAAGINPAAKFLEFQERFGGLQLFAASMQELVELGLLFDTGDGNYQILGTDDEGEWIIAVGRFANSDHVLMMDEDGILYADTVPIADSIEKWLELHAVAMEMQLSQPEWYSTAFMTVHRDDKRFDSIIDLPRIEEASDGYSTWWGTDSTRFERSVFWEPNNQTHVIRGFAKNESHVAGIVWPFEQVFGATPPILWWPYRMEEGEAAKP